MVLNDGLKHVVAAAGMLRPLVRALASGSSAAAQTSAVRALSLMAAGSWELKTAIVAAGALRPLVQMMTTCRTCC